MLQSKLPAKNAALRTVAGVLFAVPVLMASMVPALSWAQTNKFSIVQGRGVSTVRRLFAIAQSGAFRCDPVLRPSG